MIKLVHKYYHFLRKSICLGLLLSPTIISAQFDPPTAKEIKPAVMLIGKSMKDSVVLRWAPNTPELWQNAIDFGYIIEKRIVAIGDNFIHDNPHIQILTNNPIRPHTLQQMEPIAYEDNYTAIVAQAIYGKSFEVSTNQNNDIISMINIARERSNRFSFALYATDLSVNAAKAAGFYFVDHDIKPEEKYLYRVYANIPQTIMRADTGKVYISASDIQPVPKPIKLKAKWGDKAVELSWNRKYFERVFTYYIIERSDDNGSTFKRINDLPVVEVSPKGKRSPQLHYYVDSLPMNEVNYLYRVRGVTPFGEISPPSDTVSGKGEPKSPYINPIIVDHKIINDKIIEVIWEVPEQNSNFITGFYIEKSNNSEGPFIPLNNNIDRKFRSYVDSLPYAVNYYRVCSFDKKGKAFCSFPSLVQLPDSFPPAIPQDLSGTIDSTGIVSLSWSKNQEPDLEGYRIFMANTPNAEFVKINQTTIKNEFYYDTTTINTLSKYIYYKIAAIDKHYNQSGYSETLKLTRPDIVPPSPPLIYNVASSDSGILIQWHPSSSNDVLKHALYRKHEKENDWILIHAQDTSSKNNNYLDNFKESGITLQYILIAIDDSGLESPPSNRVKVSIAKKQTNDNKVRFNGKANYYEKSIELRWNNMGEKVKRYYIFKKINDGQLQLYRSVESSKRAFSDTQVRKDFTYTYLLQVIYSDGTKSPMRESVTINF